MNLSIGIVGLPNVGKRTLFNALLKKSVAYVANYPFATIEPNVGVVEVPDSRLPVLAKIVNTQKIVPAVVEFYDIAGLVKGASVGEGLGNKFLSHIREVAAIAHVVRIFEDPGIIHVTNKVDPISDIQTVETELILSDMTTLSKQHEPKGKASKEDLFLYTVVQKLEKKMEEILETISTPSASSVGTSLKGGINRSPLKGSIPLKTAGGGVFNNHIYLNAKLENDVLALSEDDQKAYLKEYGLTETGLNRLIKTAYFTLGLISFLTAGEKEVRAWTITKGTLAPQAAGTIHTDFEKHFIKADVIPYQDFVDLGGWVNAREQGKVQSTGKDYVMQDGEVVEFKVGV